MTIASARIDIEADILRVLAQRDPDVALLPVPLVTTATSGDTLGVRSTVLGRGTGRGGRYDGRVVKVAETVASGPAIGETAGVDDAGFDLTDDLTTSPAFSLAVQSGTDLHVYPKGLAPETVVDGLNRVLRATEAPHLWAPSLADDSDFDANDLTNWPAVGTPATREFVTTTASGMLFGERALQLITDAIGEGAESTSIPTYEGEMLLVSAHVAGPTGDVQVVLRNRSAATDLRTSGVVTDPLPSEVRFSQAVVDDMESAAVRFVNSAVAIGTFHVFPHIIVQSDRRRAYLAPSWLIGEGQVLDLLYLPLGADSEADDAFVALGAEMRAAMGLGFIRSDRDVNPLRLEFANYTGLGPVYLRCKRPFAELTTDAATTPCDRQYLVQKALSLILRDRDDGEWRRWASSAAKRAAPLGYGGRELRSEQAMTRV